MSTHRIEMSAGADSCRAVLSAGAFVLGAQLLPSDARAAGGAESR